MLNDMVGVTGSVCGLQPFFIDRKIACLQYLRKTRLVCIIYLKHGNNVFLEVVVVGRNAQTSILALMLQGVRELFMQSLSKESASPSLSWCLTVAVIIIAVSQFI